jgi:hypothetical protein
MSERNPPRDRESRESPNLEVISSDRDEDAERRRLPRVAFGGEQFRLSANGKVFSITDLSLEGLAFRVLDPADLVLFTVGAVLEGTLNLRTVKFPFRAQVRHERRDLVGCQFEWLGPGLAESLARYLDPAELGKELRPAPPLAGGVIFYRGPSGTQFELARSVDGEFQRFTILVLGHLVQWERETGLTTGRPKPSREQSENRGSVRYETVLLERDAKPDPGKLDVAKRLLVSSNLPENLVRWCVRQLTIA